MQQLRKYLPQLISIFILLLLLRVIPAWAAKHPETIERLYAHGLYPVIKTMLQTLFSFLPFSLAEFLVICGIAGILVWLVFFVRKLFRKQWPLVLKSLLKAIIVGLSVFLGFYFLWGFNYFRLPVTASLGLEAKLYAKEDLQNLCDTLVKQASSFRACIPEDADSTTAMGSRSSLLSAVPGAYAVLQKHVPVLAGKVTTPKPVLILNNLMCYAHIAGMYFPFTGEANVSTKPPPLYLSFYACHETAHQLGIAREDEANFVAYLAGMASDDVRFRYSATMMALAYAGSALAKTDRDAYRMLYASYSEGMKCDLQRQRNFWIQYEDNIVERVASSMNDRYLKAQGQASGVQSYGHFVDWLLAAQEMEKLKF